MELSADNHDHGRTMDEDYGYVGEVTMHYTVLPTPHYTTPQYTTPHYTTLQESEEEEGEIRASQYYPWGLTKEGIEHNRQAASAVSSHCFITPDSLLLILIF